MTGLRSLEKTILITGTSSGFGRLVVRPLLGRGFKVICAMRGGQDRLAELFSEEIQKFGRKILAVDLHMESPETYEGAAQLIEEQCASRLDVLINNAGYGLFGAIEDQSIQQIQHQYNVNVFGPVFLTRRMMPYLRNARGRVINLSSVAGLVTFPFYASYSSSKYALESFTEGLYYEAKSQGVQVALIEPGAFKTEFTKKSITWGSNSGSPQSPYFESTANFKKFLAGSSARLGNPNRVVRVMIRLCEKKRIPLRTIVGADARFLYYMKWIFPDRVFVGFINFIWKILVFKER